MHVLRKGLGHLSTSNVGDRMQRKTVIHLVHRRQVLSHAVDHQPHQLRSLVHKQRNGQVTNLLLGIFGRADQIDGLHMANRDGVAEDVREHDLGQVLLLGAAVQIPLLELLPDVGHLLVDALFLKLPYSTRAQVRDVLLPALVSAERGQERDARSAHACRRVPCWQMLKAG